MMLLMTQWVTRMMKKRGLCSAVMNGYSLFVVCCLPEGRVVDGTGKFWVLIFAHETGNNNSRNESRNASRQRLLVIYLLTDCIVQEM